MSQFSRRAFLKGTTVAAGTATFASLFGYANVFGQPEGDDPQTILDLACTAETFACTHYFNAINSADALNLDPTEIRDLKSFLDAELKHKQYLEANGANALATDFFVPENLFVDRELFVTTTDTAENWFISAYMASTRRFSELGAPLLAATSAQVAGVEAEHQALIRQMAGLVPSNRALKMALFYNTSEVAPLFQPFLEGGEGFVGPASFPGADAINALVGDNGVTDVVPFTSLTDGIGTQGRTDADVMAASTGSGVCQVSGNNVNIRNNPGLDGDIVGSLTSGTPMDVIGRTEDPSGFTWLKISQGWVRIDVVQLTGNCAAVPVS